MQKFQQKMLFFHNFIRKYQNLSRFYSVIIGKNHFVLNLKYKTDKKKRIIECSRVSCVKNFFSRRKSARVFKFKKSFKNLHANFFFRFSQEIEIWKFQCVFLFRKNPEIPKYSIYSRKFLKYQHILKIFENYKNF
jgi:hypothetical protein